MPSMIKLRRMPLYLHVRMTCFLFGYCSCCIALKSMRLNFNQSLFAIAMDKHAEKNLASNSNDSPGGKAENSLQR